MELRDGEAVSTKITTETGHHVETVSRGNVASSREEPQSIDTTGTPISDAALEKRGLDILAKDQARRSNGSGGSGGGSSSGDGRQSAIEALRKMNADYRTSADRIQPADPIYVHHSSGASVYCGGWSCALKITELAQRNIRRIINCQGEPKPNDQPFEENRFREDIDQATGRRKWVECEQGTAAGDAVRILYLRFNINGIDREYSGHCGHDQNKPERSRQVYEKFAAMFSFADEGLSRGEGVLIHCAAGMHRAGGASVAYLMHKHRLNYKKAKELAQTKRKVIDPYHEGLLGMVEAAAGCLA